MEGVNKEVITDVMTSAASTSIAAHGWLMACHKEVAARLV
jgi:hypothetical protein